MILLIVVPMKFPAYNHIIPLSSNSADAHRGFADENSSPKDLGGGISMVSEPSQVRAIKWVRIKLIKFNVPKLWSGVTFFLQGPLAEERAWILVRGGLN